MALAAVSDIEDRLAVELTATQQSQVEYLLDAATTTVLQSIGKDQDWVDDQDELPDTLKRVTVEIVCRVYNNPDAVDSKRETIGSYSYSEDLRNEAVDRAGRPLPPLFPTPAERAMLREAVGAPTTTGVRMESVLDDVFPNIAPTKWMD